MAACNQGQGQPGQGHIWRQNLIPQGLWTDSLHFFFRLLSEGHLSSCYMSLSNKASKRASASKMEATEVTFYHLCYILVIPIKSLGPAHTQGEEYQDGDHWGHHRGCLSHMPSISSFFIASITNHAGALSHWAQEDLQNPTEWRAPGSLLPISWWDKGNLFSLI